ncbi:GGDEF domain-containing protein [Paraferrimonas sedimenticola]|uniref:diguanylate cyclase n=1 Tax=Paraferrimonas sedimenticola TaxID=375674 RepID=A0AA37RXZ8_9GAMM|nr:sensor domain-containing diguanylate cyclase [Paraferrimonas sedimenticola]GLP97223.1 diguanylate cyclase [Paraferrimonas sedimenticola]
MNLGQNAMKELHWLIDMVQTLEVGLVVLDKDYQVHLWNGFMENHSGVSLAQMKHHNLFEVMPDLPQDWLKSKMETVFLLKNRAFTSWEQRPYVFEFKNYRPITGQSEFMYQNMTIFPLTSLTGEVNHIGLIIYDVSDMAINKLQLKQANLQLQKLSRTDDLTGLNNRRFWSERLQHEYDRFTRYGGACSLVLFDVDHFKRVNDTLGHDAGDYVLAELGKLVQRNLRETDVAGRYGGEEFAVILEGTDADSALYYTERLRKLIAQLALEYQGESLTVTVSLGIAQLDSSMDSTNHWVQAADRAMYQAKRLGRNCSQVHPSINKA